MWFCSQVSRCLTMCVSMRMCMIMSAEDIVPYATDGFAPEVMDDFSVSFASTHLVACRV
jgi:hypothetical protein